MPDTDDDMDRIGRWAEERILEPLGYVQVESNEAGAVAMRCMQCRGTLSYYGVRSLNTLCEIMLQHMRENH